MMKVLGLRGYQVFPYSPDASTWLAPRHAPQYSLRQREYQSPMCILLRCMRRQLGLAQPAVSSCVPLRRQGRKQSGRSLPELSESHQQHARRRTQEHQVNVRSASSSVGLLKTPGVNSFRDADMRKQASSLAPCPPHPLPATFILTGDTNSSRHQGGVTIVLDCVRCYSCGPLCVFSVRLTRAWRVGGRSEAAFSRYHDAYTVGVVFF